MYKGLGKQQLRYWLVAGVCLVITPFLFGFETTKNITIKYDNNVKTIVTSSNVPKLILLNAGVKLEPGDGWKYDDIHKKLEDGCTIEVVRGVPFQVVYNGQTKNFKTSKDTVGSALKSVGISYKGEKLYPPAHTKFHKNMKIIVLNEGEHMKLADDLLAKAPVTYIDDKNLAAGVEKVVKPGKPPKVKIVSRVYKNASGNLITQEVGHVELEPGENAVVHRGVARSIKTPQGYKRYSKLLNCEATAYTHTGNPTATGIMPYVGVVAVDPRYIPLGTKMFIPGYGMAVAADTGGDMIHHSIDLFMNTRNECFQWGRRMVQVYIFE